MKIPILLLAAGFGLTAATLPAGQPKKIVAYLPLWGDLEKGARDTPFAKVTHLNLAFENPLDESGTLSFHEAAVPIIVRAHAAGVKVLVSIGGGSASEDTAMRTRYAKLLAPPQRAAFVGKLSDFVTAHQLDGVDVDLEGDAIGANYGEFLNDLSASLTPKGKLLTAALAHGNGGDRVPPDALAKLDFLNVMAYDATGPWEPQNPGQHSSMEFAKSSIAWWSGRGVPNEKLILGVPFYGHGFGADFNKDGWPYSAILAKHPAAWQQDQVGATIYYNGEQLIRDKAAYVLAEKLGGIMIWSIDQDAQGERSLLDIIHAKFDHAGWNWCGWVPPPPAKDTRWIGIAALAAILGIGWCARTDPPQAGRPPCPANLKQGSLFATRRPRPSGEKK